MTPGGAAPTWSISLALLGQSDVFILAIYHGRLLLPEDPEDL